MFARRMSSSALLRWRGWLAAACIGLLVFPALASASSKAIAAAAAVSAPEAFVPTPAQLFGPLFQQVQMDALFPDGKAFPDAAPDAPPPVILRRYRRADPRSRAALLRFVRSNFSFPTEAQTPPAQPDKSLEAHIARLWPLLTRQPAVPPPYSSRLYVPQPYVVPGGRFREIYYWDSYFTMLGLIRDGHLDTAAALSDDFADLIATYGHVPNGSRSYYLSRSQPPVFYLMVDRLAHGSGERLGATPAGRSSASTPTGWRARPA